MKEGKKDGFGEYYAINGNIYKGSFRNDFRSGQGKYKYFSTGEEYDGNWEKDMKSGFGTFTYAYGDIYEGNWV